MDKKAQITLESSLIIVIVTAAWLGAQGYFKRAVQGGWRANTDSFSDEQYDRTALQETDSTLTFSLAGDKATSETISPITFVGSRITAKTINYGQQLGNPFDLASEKDSILTIPGWHSE